MVLKTCSQNFGSKGPKLFGLQPISGQSYQNYLVWGQFSVFEATSRACYDIHLLNCEKWYSKLAPKISGQLDQNCAVCGQF